MTDASGSPLSSPAELPSLHAFLRRNAELGGRKLRKSANYIDLYERIFSLVGRRPRILEIGIQHGGSLQMWNEFFQGDVEIFGIDILPECKRFEEGNIHILIGDQSDPSFLAKASQTFGGLDVVIDDGSHVSRHQIDSFETLFYNNLKNGGYYIVEDCVTSYWPEYGGGLRRRGTFIEYSKLLCDSLNAWNARSKNLPASRATRSIKRITFESSLVIFEKAAMSAPPVVSSGDKEIDTVDIFGDALYARLLRYLRRFPALRYAVRNNQFLWKAMRAVIDKANRTGDKRRIESAEP